MLNLELARKLKEVGLKWEPKFGDHYIIPAVFEEGLHEVMDTKQVMSYHKNPKEWEESINDFVFAPRLDQLLAEIEKRGYFMDLLGPYNTGEWRIILGGSVSDPHFYADTPEEAAAAALIWICLKGS